MNIRLATAADIPAILALERTSASAAHWTEAQYQSFFQNEKAGSVSNNLVLLIEQNSALTKSESALLGFLVAHCIDREWELENIAIAPDARRKSLATRLVEELLRHARRANGEAVFLEVRESNYAARALYEKLDFTQTGRRKAYYQNPPEDAILYRRAL